MSRFFKSAAFPILIVVVLAFFASKLVGESNKTHAPTYGTTIQSIKNGSVQNVTLDQKDNSMTVELKSGQKYTTGYTDSGLAQIENDVIKYEGGNALIVQDKSSNGWLS